MAERQCKGYKASGSRCGKIVSSKAIKESGVQLCHLHSNQEEKEWDQAPSIGTDESSVPIGESSVPIGESSSVTNPQSGESGPTKVVNIKKAELQKIGYENLERWLENGNHLYIGRSNGWVAGARKSKWHNPFSVKSHGLETCLELYEEHIRSNPELMDSLEELRGKTLGCWCKPSSCHGDILVKLLSW